MELHLHSHCVAAFVLLTLTPAAASAQSSIPYTERVETRDKEIFIGADPTDEVLVFPAGTMVLDGKALNINAGKIELQGDFTIRAFAVGTTAPAKQGEAQVGPTGGGGAKESQGGTGLQGSQGATGDPGASANPVRLRFTEISGPGKLLVINDGANGGKGQMGGQGGHGGVGGPGHNRSCNIGHRDSPRNGGKGGTGGLGGKGGTGGVGGNGGPIIFLEKLKRYVDSGQVVVSSLPGNGGDPGTGGRPGVRGDGGKGGEGGSCGGGSDAGPSGDPGETGPKGDPGSKGSPGVITSTAH